MFVAPLLLGGAEGAAAWRAAGRELKSARRARCRPRCAASGDDVLVEGDVRRSIG